MFAWNAIIRLLVFRYFHYAFSAPSRGTLSPDIILSLIPDYHLSFSNTRHLTPDFPIKRLPVR